MRLFCPRGTNLRLFYQLARSEKPFKRIAELISDLSGQNISEGTVQNILKENSGKADSIYKEISYKLLYRDYHLILKIQYL